MSGTTYTAYSDATTAVVSRASAATKIETGYVQVTKGTDDTGYTSEVPGFAKANSSFTVKVTATSAPAATTSLYVANSEKDTAAQAGNGTKTEFTFTVDTKNADVTGVAAKAVATYTVAAPR